MAANLNDGLQRGLRYSLMRSLSALLPYAEAGYWVIGYASKD